MWKLANPCVYLLDVYIHIFIQERPTYTKLWQRDNHSQSHTFLLVAFFIWAKSHVCARHHFVVTSSHSDTLSQFVELFPRSHTLNTENFMCSCTCTIYDGWCWRLYALWHLKTHNWLTQKAPVSFTICIYYSHFTRNPWNCLNIQPSKTEKSENTSTE